MPTVESVRTKVINFRVRVIRLEHLVEFLYQKLNIEYVEDVNTADDPKVIESIKQGKRIETITVNPQLTYTGHE